MLKHTVFAAAAAAIAAMAACSAEAPEAAAEPSAAEAPAAATRSLAAVQINPLATAEERLAQAEAFLAENGAREGVMTTASGLQYEVLAEGPDGPSPAPGQWVCVHYRGALIDGTEFDSSYSRGQAMAHPSDRFIPGWVEALSMMKAGDAWRLVIHPDLAYGARELPGIPGNSTLVFDMSLIKLLDGEPAPGANCAA